VIPAVRQDGKLSGFLENFSAQVAAGLVVAGIVAYFSWPRIKRRIAARDLPAGRWHCWRLSAVSWSRLLVRTRASLTRGEHWHALANGFSRQAHCCPVKFKPNKTSWPASRGLPIFAAKKINRSLAAINTVIWIKCEGHCVRWVACVKQAMTVEGEESELWLPSTLRDN
jgi:hypothetical protein